MTREEVEKLPRADYFDGYKCPVCYGTLTAYCGRMYTIEEHCRILGDDLMGSDYLLLHSIGSSCENAASVAGVVDYSPHEQIDQTDFVRMT